MIKLFPFANRCAFQTHIWTGDFGYHPVVIGLFSLAVRDSYIIMQVSSLSASEGDNVLFSSACGCSLYSQEWLHCSSYYYSTGYRAPAVEASA